MLVAFRTKFLLPLLCPFLSVTTGCWEPLYGQISVEPAILFSPEDLIANVFLGDGVEVIDIQFNGSPRAVGLFNNGQNDIGIDNGILMSTGFAKDAGKKNSTPDNTGSPPGAASTDPDLATIANDELEDVAIYEITFVPTADTLRFRYVFASEEYPEWACSNFNDIFGFFIYGPGISGPYTNNAANIALVPDPADPSGLTFTNLPVTINNVNDQGIDPAGGCFYDYSTYYNTNPAGNTPTFDGFLDVFTAQAIVQPCETYTIKLAIADRGDPDYDTAVFLEAKSFGTGSLDVQTATLSLDNSVAEGCAAGSVIFSLPGIAESDYLLDYTIFGTATNGMDYAFIPTDTFIPAGQQSVALPIIAFEDGLSEPLESISIDVQRDICKRDTFTIFISDQQILPPQVRSDTSICQGQSVQLDGTLPISLPTPPIFTNDTDMPINTISNNEPPMPGQQPTVSDILVGGVQPPELQEGVIKAVCIDVEHIWISDVDVFLFGPDGQFIELTTDNGGSGQNYTSTCFTPLATDTIDFGSQAPNTEAPFTGDWYPEGQWSFLYDLPTEVSTNGTWQLLIKDDQTGLDGTLLGWSICFNPVYRLNYEWAPAAGLSCADCPNPVASPDTTTTYVLTATDSYGCSVQDSVTIMVDSILAAPFNLMCGNITNSSIEFSWEAVPGANGYEVNIDGQGWMVANPGQLSHLVSGLTLNDTATIEVRGIGPCGGQIATLSCNTPPCMPPMLFVNNTAAASCIGVNNGTASFSAIGSSPPFVFTISPGGQSNTTGNFTNLAPGNYQLEVLNALNCPARLNFNIGTASGISALPIVVNHALCKGQSNGQATFSLANGTAPYLFNWSNLQTDSVASGLAADTHYVTITDAVGCQLIDSLTIAEPDSLELSFLPTAVSCNGAQDGSAEASGNGGTPPYNFIWDANTGNQMGPLANGLNGGSYQVTLTDDNGCQQTDRVLILENAAILPTVVVSDVSCFGGTDGSASADASGGAGNFTFQWNDPAMQSGVQANNLSSGNYQLLVTDEDGCTATTDIEVLEPPAIQIQLLSSDLLCADSSNGSATLIVNGGTYPYAYFWSDNPSATDSLHTDLAAGNYSVTISDGNRCDTILDFSIGSPSALLLSTTDAILGCQSSNSGTVIIAAEGGFPPYQYQWDAQAGASTNDTVTNLLPGIYFVTVTDANGCSAIDSANVIQSTPLSIQLSTEPIKCFGDSNGSAMANLNGGRPPYQFSWSTGADSAFIHNLSAGLYILTVSDSDGCSIIDSVSINEPSMLLLEVEPDTVSCAGDSDGELLVMASGGQAGYTFSLDSGFFSMQNNFVGLTPGSYNIIVRDSNGCETQVIGQVADRPVFSIDLGEDRSLQLGDSIRIFAIRNNGVGDLFYTWLPADSTVRCPQGGYNCYAPWLLTDNAGSYQITAVDENGCVATDRIAIFIEKERPAYVPTGFTPNDDDHNDLLLVHGRPDSRVLVFRIYNRWGELLYQAENYDINSADIGWDGTFRGEPVDSDVYIWYVEIEFEDGFRQLFKGNTTLIR